jgi:hypothetical protein
MLLRANDLGGKRAGSSVPARRYEDRRRRSVRPLAHPIMNKLYELVAWFTELVGFAE